MNDIYRIYGSLPYKQLINQRRSKALQTVQFYEHSPILNMTRQSDSDIISNEHFNYSMNIQQIVEDAQQEVRICNQLLDEIKKGEMLKEITNEYENIEEVQVV